MVFKQNDLEVQNHFGPIKGQGISALNFKQQTLKKKSSPPMVCTQAMHDLDEGSGPAGMSLLLKMVFWVLEICF